MKLSLPDVSLESTEKGTGIHGQGGPRRSNEGDKSNCSGLDTF